MEVGSRESREITVLRLELDELCEERQSLIGGAHCNGASKGADDGNEAKYEIKHRQPFADSPAQGRLGCLAMLTGSLHCERSKDLTLVEVEPDSSAGFNNTAPSPARIYIHGELPEVQMDLVSSIPEQVAVQGVFCEYFQVHFG
jgi:hypothetical protein